MIKLWRFLSVAIVAAVCLGLLLVPAMSVPTVLAATDVGIEIHPSKANVEFNEAFTADIVINNSASHSINAYAYNLTFPPALVTIESVTVNTSVFSIGGDPDWSNTSGWLVVGKGKSGNTTLSSINIATISFKSKSSSGVAALNFVPDPDTAVYDADTAENVIDPARVVNGTVSVGLLPALTVNIAPAGKGTVKADGVTLTGYPNTTNRSWDANVTLLAVNSTPGWVFLNWTGNLTGSTNPMNITMDSNKNVTANFYGQGPAISVSPANLTFSGNVGENVTNKTLQICNGGGDILNWTANITYSAVTGWTFGWLSMSPTSGTNLAATQCNSTQVAVNTTGLTEGTYHANITISEAVIGAPGRAESAVGKFLITTVTVPVTLNLGVPEISASPTPLTFTTNEGENPADKTLEVCNMGNGTLNWLLTDNAAWLSENPTSGSLGADECEDVTVSVAASSLAAGDYSATITITGPGASNTPQSVPVSLHIVSAMPTTPPVAPAQLKASGLSISPHQVNPDQEVTISINVANSGGETGSYNAVLYINGAVEDSQSVSVAPGMTKNVIFAVSKSKAGVYDVLIAGQSGQFTVVHTGWFGGGLGTSGIIVIVVIVIVLILALVFVLRGTRRAV